MDEIVVAQNKYISSKRASRLTGYAQDYIGQMVRMGKLKATKVGKAWFVEEDSLMRAVGSSDRLTGPVKDLATLEVTKSNATVSAVRIQYPKTWSPISYLQDSSELYPISDNRDDNKNKDFLSFVASNNSNGLRSSTDAFVLDTVKGSNSLRSSTKGKAIAFDSSIPATHNARNTKLVNATSVDGVRFYVQNSSESNLGPTNDLASINTGHSAPVASLPPYKVKRLSFGHTVLRAFFASLAVGFVVFFVPLL